MRHPVLALALAVASLLLTAAPALADTPPSRYVHTGDGVIVIASARGAAFSGRYRKADGTYDTAALRRIHAVFGARLGDPIRTISPRFIEFLDFLQDQLSPGGRITIYSGYRSPEYNTNLRNNGKLAAKASLHQYGMAADLTLAGVPSERVWTFVRELGFGGAGFYHGKQVHVDVGPARFWDEATSGVGTDISDENKLITLVADKDIYLPAEPIELRFIRMTAFPIGVAPTFELQRQQADGSWKPAQSFVPAFAIPAGGACPQFGDISQMLGIRWELPAGLAGGRYRVRASFCDKSWEAMPADIATDAFEVRAP